MQCFRTNNRYYSTVSRLRSHLKKELEMNDTPYGLRVMATDHPTNKSVGFCPKDITTYKLNELVALYESIWMGASPDWTTLQIHLGRLKKDLTFITNRLRICLWVFRESISWRGFFFKFNLFATLRYKLNKGSRKS